MSRPSRSVLLATLTVAVAACAGPGPMAPPSPSPTLEARLEGIRAARQAVAQPAIELRAAAERVAARLEALRTEPPQATGPDAATQRAARLLDGPLAELADAIASATAVSLPDGPDAAAAGDALSAGAEAAAELAPIADAEREELVELTTVDARLAELVGAWEEPGSRSTQIARFGELAGQAEALATELEGRAPRHSCSTAYVRRAEAARHVADVSRELQDLVRRYRGTTFDERLAELEDDPLDTGGVPAAETDAEEIAGCWDASAAVEALDDVDAALGRLEQALNPEEVTTTTPAP